ncbi:MAG: Flp pilus assembly protein, protease CpaA [Deltaproteobacteria bacterium]|nr:Flp pilus assembly protein, protease CpaA [Deltaproteobacteria bacterium]
MDAHTAASFCVATVCLIACAYDVRFRRIPNALTLGAAAGGLAFNVFLAGLHGAGASLAGLLVGTALFFPFFALGGLGAGDIKLMGAIGAWLGPTAALWASLFAAMAGGVFALLLALYHGYARKMLGNLWLLLGHWRMFGIKPMPDLTLAASRGPRLAYALPITVGTLVELWLR